MVSYFDETLQALASGNTYVSPAAAAAATAPIDASSIKQAIGTQDIAVVILPASASQEVTSLPDFARNVASSTSYDTVLVVVGDDFEAVSKVLPQGRASEIANQVEASFPGISDAAQQFVAEVSTQANVPPSSEEVPTIAIGGILVAGIVAVAAAGLAFKHFRHRPSSIDGIHATLRRVEILARQVRDPEISKSVLACLTSIKTLIIDVQDSRITASQFQSAYEQPLLSYEKFLKLHIQVQDDERSATYDAKTRDTIRSYVRSSTKTLTDKSVDQHREILNNSLSDFYLESASFDAMFPENILNER